MQKLFFVVFAVLAMWTLVSNASAQDQWVPFAPEGGAFSVLMPRAPEAETDTKPSELGPYTTKLYTVTVPGIIYLVGYVDYQPTVRLDIQGEIAATRDKFLKGVKGTLIAEKKITLDGNPGIEFTADVGAKNFVTSRIYVVGQRPYQILAVTRKGADQTDASKFLSSFKLVKK